MTNGEKIQQVFPGCEVYDPIIEDNIIHVSFVGNPGSLIGLDYSWWIKEYKEPRKGHWIDGHCSECGCDIPAYIIDWKWQKDMDAKYCPNCGAYMRGEET